MPHLVSRLALVLLAGLAWGAPAALAQSATRVRATVTAVQGDDLLVRTKEDQELVVRLLKPLTVTARVKADASAIQPGRFVGAASVPGKGGALSGVEIVVFPEALRGAGEGHRAWEPLPEGTMTNATVAEDVTSADGKSFKLTYKGGEQTIAITPETRVFTLADGAVADLKPGAAVSFGVDKDADGHLQTRRVTVDR